MSARRFHIQNVFFHDFLRWKVVSARRFHIQNVFFHDFLRWKVVSARRFHIQNVSFHDFLRWKVVSARRFHIQNVSFHDFLRWRFIFFIHKDLVLAGHFLFSRGIRKAPPRDLFFFLLALLLLLPPCSPLAFLLAFRVFPLLSFLLSCLHFSLL